MKMPPSNMTVECRAHEVYERFRRLHQDNLLDELVYAQVSLILDADARRVADRTLLQKTAPNLMLQLIKATEELRGLASAPRVVTDRDWRAPYEMT